MTIALDSAWDEDAHLREVSSGQFIEHLHSVPDIDDLAPESEPDIDRDPYNPVFRVPAHMLGAVQARIDAANARLERSGIADRFTFTTEHVVEKRNRSTSYEFIDVTLDRPSISFEGWSFTGAHDFTPGGGVLHLYMAPGTPLVTDNHCDHCGAKRARNRVYTVVHPEEGTMQVGASCLDAFLGMKPAGLWAIGDDLGLDDSERMYGKMTSPGTRVFPMEELVIAALTATKDGANYVTQQTAVFPERPTAFVVRDQWEKLLADGDTKERGILARKVIRWARKIDAPPGSYLDNLHQVFVGKKDELWVRTGQVGFAVSVVSAYRREQDQTVAVEAVPEKVVVQDSYLAEEGEKVAGITATIQLVKHDSEVVRGIQRDSTWMTMLSDTGHLLTWNASKDRDEKSGDRVTISTATVKGHKKYGSQFQTVLTRAKMGPAEDM